jgi:hypothetical protein
VQRVVQKVINTTSLYVLALPTNDRPSPKDSIVDPNADNTNASQAILFVCELSPRSVLAFLSSPCTPPISQPPRRPRNVSPHVLIHSPRRHSQRAFHHHSGLQPQP